jgi:hypothetical protein
MIIMMIIIIIIENFNNFPRIQDKVHSDEFCVLLDRVDGRGSGG